MKELKLDNGLQVLLYPLSTHSVSIGLYIRCGLLYESPELTGITHLLEHLHFRMSDTISQEQLYYDMERIGTTLCATTYADYIRFNLKVHPDYIQDALEMFNAVLSCYHWTKRDFDDEKNVVIRQIKEKADYLYIEDLAKKTVFDGVCVASEIMGSCDTVKNITIDKIIEYKKEIFNRDNMLLCITGKFNDDIELILNSKINFNIMSGERKYASYIPPNAFRRDCTVNIQNQNFEITDCCIAFDVDLKKVKSDELDLLNCILGEGTGSRLQMELREKCAYTSNICSYIDSYEDYAVLYVSFSTDADMLKDSIANVIKVISSMKEKIYDRDVEVTLPFYTKNAEFDLDDTELMNHRIANRLFITGRELNFSLPVNGLCERLQQAAKSIFVADNLTVAILGDVKLSDKNNIIKIIKSSL